MNTTKVFTDFSRDAISRISNLLASENDKEL